jgi:hypothetical protein
LAGGEDVNRQIVAVEDGTSMRFRFRQQAGVEGANGEGVVS